MKNVMISCPACGRSAGETVNALRRARNAVAAMGDQVAAYYTEDEAERPLWYLGESLKMMSRVDAVYFCSGWEQSRGCRIQHQTAKEYNKECIYEV